MTPNRFMFLIVLGVSTSTLGCDSGADLLPWPDFNNVNYCEVSSGPGGAKAIDLAVANRGDQAAIANEGWINTRLVISFSHPNCPSCSFTEDYEHPPSDFGPATVERVRFAFTRNPELYFFEVGGRISVIADVTNRASELDESNNSADLCWHPGDPRQCDLFELSESCPP